MQPAYKVLANNLQLKRMFEGSRWIVSLWRCLSGICLSVCRFPVSRSIAAWKCENRPRPLAHFVREVFCTLIIFGFMTSCSSQLCWDFRFGHLGMPLIDLRQGNKTRIHCHNWQTTTKLSAVLQSAYEMQLSAQSCPAGKCIFSFSVLKCWLECVCVWSAHVSNVLKEWRQHSGEEKKRRNAQKWFNNELVEDNTTGNGSAMKCDSL